MVRVPTGGAIRGQALGRLPFFQKESTMNRDIFGGNWKQLKGQVRNWWGQLTDDDVDQIAGNRDMLIGKLQERYGWSKERANEEVDRRFSGTSDLR